MSKTVRCLITAFFMVLGAQTHALTLKPDAPERYVVKKGDTLWGIAERYTEDAWQWPNIWYQNEEIDNPHLIFPGDVIGLIHLTGGKPVSSDGGSGKASKQGEVKLTVVKRGESSRTVKLTPTARIEPIEAAIPTIPMDAIAPFITHNRIVTQADLKNAPYVLSAGANRLMSGAGEAIYARGNFSEGAAGAYGVFRASTLYRDPRTQEILGLEAREIGLGNVEKQEGDIIKLMLTKTNQQVREGDRLLTTENRELISRFHPKAPDEYVTGLLIAVPGGVTQIGQYSMVVINLGLRDGVSEGAILDIMQQGEVVRDRVANKKVRLPSEKAGQLMVFRADEKLSYALVLKATRPIKVGDQVQSPY